MKDNSSKLYTFIRPLGVFLMKVIYRPTIINNEKIPISGPIILCGNHTFEADPLLVGMSTSRVVHFLSKNQLFKTRFTKWFFTSVGCIPVDRSKRDSNATSMAENALKEEKVIGIFPEGTINRTKDIILPFKYGALSFAKKTGALIIPFSITGKYKIFRKSVKIIFGDAIDIKDMDIEEAHALLENKVKELITIGRKTTV